MVKVSNIYKMNYSLEQVRIEPVATSLTISSGKMDILQ